MNLLKLNLKNNIFPMSITDLKIYCLNLTTLGITFTHIDIFLKVILVAITIGYTIYKWYLLWQKQKIK